MSLYCLCTGANEDNYELPVELGLPERSVVLMKRMVCIKTGAQQYLNLGGVRPTRHYPNADLYQCPRCDRIVAKD